MTIPPSISAADERLEVPGLRDLTREWLTAVGEDPEREGLQKTPHRVAKAWGFLTAGYQRTLHDAAGDAVFEADGSEMVIVKDIEFYSMCEHHMLPFYGRAHVAYIPDGKILGLSKFARIVDLYSRRLQVQERITTQIADAVQDLLAPQGVTPPPSPSPADHASARRVPVRLCPHHAVPARCLDVSRSRLVVSINTGLSDTTRPTPTTGEDAGVIDAGGVEKITEEDDAI